MGYDVDLAERLRDLLAGEPDVVEKRMFGGLAFLVAGHLAVAASRSGGMMLRGDPAHVARLRADPRAGPFVMRGRELDGWLRVNVEADESDAELRRWVDPAVGYARSLPDS